MNFEFLPLEQSDISIFKHDIQEAFQRAMKMFTVKSRE